MSNQSPSKDRTYNIPARVLGWEEDGRARVELVSTVDDLRLGIHAVAGVRPGTLGRNPADFAALRKAGLRTGGVVLLRKAVLETDGLITARSVETLVGRERDGLAMMLHGAAACILPPPPGTAMVAECLVALASEAVPCKGLREGLEAAGPALGKACQFGPGGLILVGEDRDGDAVEVMVGGEAELRPEEVAELFLSSCPKEIAYQASRSKKQWHLVPFFRGEVDPDRSSKLSAQRVNLDYGTDDEPMWNPTNAVLRAYVDSWLVCDVTPSFETAENRTCLLIDVVEGT